MKSMSPGLKVGFANSTSKAFSSCNKLAFPISLFQKTICGSVSRHNTARFFCLQMGHLCSTLPGDQDKRTVFLFYWLILSNTHTITYVKGGSIILKTDCQRGMVYDLHVLYAEIVPLHVPSCKNVT